MLDYAPSRAHKTTRNTPTPHPVPSQHAQNKKLVTNWFTTAEIAALKELAAAKGVDVTTLFREFIRNECKNEGIKIDEQDKAGKH